MREIGQCENCHSVFFNVEKCPICDGKEKLTEKEIFLRKIEIGEKLLNEFREKNSTKEI